VIGSLLAIAADGDNRAMKSRNKKGSKRALAVSGPISGFGLVKVKRTKSGIQRRLSEVDATELQRRPRRKL
jgi:hypothetical protein